MTEPIAVDVPKPAAVVPAPSKPEPPRAEPPKPAAKAEPSKPPFPRPPAAAAQPPLLQRLARNKAGIAAAALFSLAAGVAGVRLLVPGDDAPPTPPDTAAAPPESPAALTRPADSASAPTGRSTCASTRPPARPRPSTSTS